MDEDEDEYEVGTKKAEEGEGVHEDVNIWHGGDGNVLGEKKKYLQAWSRMIGA